MAVMDEQGQIQIHTENIFPIIKKAVYSGHEVFLRELVSNGVDAISKRRMAAMAGDCSEGEDGCIRIRVDREAKTLTITDNGIGMTADEVKRYINQVAFSSAEDFLEKYKQEDDAIIGHFGLGLPNGLTCSLAQPGRMERPCAGVVTAPPISASALPNGTNPAQM